MNLLIRHYHHLDRILPYGDYFMNKPTLKKLLLSLFLIISGLLTSSAYAWPEVDHMNMCGAASKVSQKYAGNFKGWAARDHYVNKIRRAGYYYKANCPKTVAPAKKSAKKMIKKAKLVKAKTKRIARSGKAKSFKRKVKYDKHADCVRVDGMNQSGPAVRVLRRR